MQGKLLKIIVNEPVNELRNVYRMKLSGCDEQQKPGQFVNIALDGLFLRRPISVSDWEDGVLTLLYKVVGKGTARMAAMKAGECLDVLTGLGNGYDTACSPSGSAPLLVGGGIGSAPLYLLARKLLESGAKPRVILGFNTKGEIILEKEFIELGIETTITTADGSYGVKGFVTDALSQYESDYCYTCGPLPMMKALAPRLKSLQIPAQFSLEERMGCGTGICMGCTCHTLVGPRRICKDGPVFRLDEIEL